MATTTQKNKSVQNYILDCIKYINPDESEVWVARHKVLKKAYMLKKVKYFKAARQGNEKGDGEDEANALNMQKIIRQVELLKAAKIQGAPKCQKMIKTTNNVYVVYDEFPGITLAELLKTHRKSYEQKIGIMLQIAKKLQSFHQQQVIFLQLSPQNVLVQNQQHVFFSQWSLCIFKNNPKCIFPINNASQSQFIAYEALQESQFSSASDIYSIGKIFTHIIYCNKNTNKEIDFPKQVYEITANMTERKVEKRPSLQTIIQVLEKSRENITERLKLVQSNRLVKMKKEQTPTEVSTSPTFQTENSQVRSNLFSNLSPSMLKQKSSPELIKASKTCKNLGAISFDNILTGMSRNISRPNISRIKKTSEGLARKMNKNRNLSFFILELSEFAMKWPQGEYLSFLLLKQAYHTLNSCYLQWKNQDFFDGKSATTLQVLKNEMTQMNLSLNMMKEYFLSSTTQPQFKAELRNDLSINEKYFREQILSFSNELMKQINTLIRQNKVSLNSLVNDLFSVYMILKRVEQGSFEKYWEKIYSSQYAFLKNQKYFNEEKKLGYRYLKSKITEILNKK